MPYRVAFVTTHPIQYQAPLFRLLHARPDVDLTVFFGHLPDAQQQGDGFGVAFHWDVPLLDGYEHVVLKNVSKSPNVTSFRGCDTPEVGRHLQRGKFDAVIVNGWIAKTCLQTLLACRRFGVPCIVRGEANRNQPRAWWKHWLHRRLVRRYAACLYIGQANREFYRHHGIPEDRLFSAPYCIDNARFAALAAKAAGQASVRRQYGVPSDRVCYLFSGKFEEKKHPRDLLKAFQIAIRSGANAHLLMVGDGALREPCQKFARENHLPVAFTGFLNQAGIVEAYMAADCLVLPSNFGETWGLVVNEAMACGRPAIVSDRVGCHEDLILSGQTGTIFPFGDWEQLASLLTEYSHQADRLREMGRRARDHIQAYSPRAAADGIVQAVRWFSGS